MAKVDTCQPYDETTNLDVIKLKLNLSPFDVKSSTASQNVVNRHKYD